MKKAMKCGDKGNGVTITGGCPHSTFGNSLTFLKNHVQQGLFIPPALRYGKTTQNPNSGQTPDYLKS